MNTPTVLAMADALSFIQEKPAGSNAGRWVEAVQKLAGGKKGDAWCAAWVSMVLGAAFRDHPPLPYTTSCDVLLESARRWEWLSGSPSAGDVFLYMKSPTDATHTGIVVSVQGGTFNTIEGNTSSPQKSVTASREGWGVFKWTRKLEGGKYQFIKYARGAT